MANKRRYFIDLLTDEEPRKFGVTAEQMAKASADFFNKLPSVNGKNGDSLHDTREKLEADILAYRGKPSEVVNMIPVWLDRQAAITEREFYPHTRADMDMLIDMNEKLQAKVDALEAENARLRSRMSDDAEYGRLVMGAYRELRAKLDEIAKVVDA